MVDTQKVIHDLLAEELSFQDFTKRYKISPSGEQVFLFFQQFLAVFHSEILKASKSAKATFQVSPNNRIKFLETRNEHLEERLKKSLEDEKKIKSFESESLKRVLNDLPKLNSSATKIQAYWRGMKTRFKLPKIVAEIRKQPKRKMNISEKVVFEVKLALSKLNLTLENAYRACDVGGDGIVTTEEFSRFLEKLRLRVGKRTIPMFLEILDENCSGNIERVEFYDCLDAFAVASENHFAYGEPYSRRVLRKFKQLINDGQVNVFEMFHKNRNLEQIPVDEFFEGFKKRFELLSREVQALTVLFDAGRTGFIRFFEFKSICESADPAKDVEIEKSDQHSRNKSNSFNQEKKSLEKSISSSPERNPLIHKLIDILKIYGLDAPGVFRFSNKMQADRISIQDFLVGLQKLIPDIFSLISEEELTLIIPNPLTQKIVSLMVDSNN